MKSPLVIAQFAAILLAFCLDRMSKSWVLAHLSGDTPMAFLPGFIQLHLTQNSGAAFSLGRENGQLMTVVATLVTIALSAWTVWRHKLHGNLMPLEKIGTGLLLGGALGNLCDRYTVGQVTDFLQFTFFDFPIFNVADALIDVGIGLIVIDVFRSGQTASGESGAQTKIAAPAAAQGPVQTRTSDAQAGSEAAKTQPGAEQ